MEDNTFIRKDFYIQPPDKGASKEEWNDWLERDARKASAAKAQHTKAQQHTQLPTWLGNSESWQSGGTIDAIGPGGVHTQGTLVGFTGDPEQGTCQVERVCPRPSPEAMVDIKASLTHFAERVNLRGNDSRKGKSARRRKNRRQK
jgi:hypothetical protein